MMSDHFDPTNTGGMTPDEYVRSKAKVTVGDTITWCYGDARKSWHVAKITDLDTDDPTVHVERGFLELSVKASDVLVGNGPLFETYWLANGVAS